MNDLEAKIVVLGSQGSASFLDLHALLQFPLIDPFPGVGKTSLVLRYVKNAFSPSSTHSTIGASFLTKRVVDDDTNTVVRLQIWDTAGQERFRSISKLYYRGANAGVLCYDITDEESFEEMGRWLVELKKNLSSDVVLHVVGTKSDLVQTDPNLRAVPFERCIAYVADHLYPSASTPPGTTVNGATSPGSKRSSGFWGQDIGWDTCHEISAKDGEGVEEVFRVITRKLVEQRNKRLEAEIAAEAGLTSGADYANGGSGYFDGRGVDGGGSFRVGQGDKRKSWLGFPQGVGIWETGGEQEMDGETQGIRKKGKCC
ncbi:MAG: hypothetical protein M1813_005015 [Trichoglossum hirsutum]|jgi:small GTP-binding protein|nr:MAG: hypothetical protein M1813_005015 [Trichoglossum hirsutum]